MIPLSTPNLRGNNLSYLKTCIRTQWVSSAGKYVNFFEKRISKYTGSKYAISCTSGTAALHLALRIIGVREDDEVIVPTMTFIATANSVKYLKASPIFMDCDEFYNLDVRKTISFIKNKTFLKNNYSYNKKTKKRIFALLVVHVYGNAVDMSSLMTICKKRNIKIVEDAAGALGTYYLKGKLKNKHAGTVSDVGCLSFNGNKIITSGGGGMILTDDKKLAQKAKYLSTQAMDDPIRYIHNDIGYNYRLTNIQAAIGLAQLEKIKFFLKRKNIIYNFYKKAFKKITDINFAKKPNYAKNNKWMLSIEIDEKKRKLKKNALIRFLFKNRIETRSTWLPIHKQRKYLNCETYKITNATKLYRKSLNIPSGTNLSLKQAGQVVKTIKKFMK